jgi:predicted metal-dependent HD superfamily phosphohydrolase
MGDLRSRLEMLKQMRWREAHQANGAERDTATDRLIRLHSAITAIEATILEGAPKGVSDLDIDGQGLTQVGMSLAQANSDAYERYQALEEDSGSVTPER